MSIFHLLGSLARSGGLALSLSVYTLPLHRIQSKFSISSLLVLLSVLFHGCGCPLEPTTFWIAAIRHPCLSLGFGTRLLLSPGPFGGGLITLVKSAISLPAFSPTIIFSLLAFTSLDFASYAAIPSARRLRLTTRAKYRVLIWFSVDSHFCDYWGVAHGRATHPHLFPHGVIHF